MAIKARDYAMLTRRKEGATFKQIGKEFGITQQRVQQAIKYLDIKPRWYDKLPVRLRNCLCNLIRMDFFDQPELDAAREAATITEWRYLRVPYFGKMCLTTLKAWLAEHNLALDKGPTQEEYDAWFGRTPEPEWRWPS